MASGLYMYFGLDRITADQNGLRLFHGDLEIIVTRFVLIPEPHATPPAPPLNHLISFPVGMAGG